HVILIHATEITVLLPSFFFSDYPPSTAIYTLSLHDALPICTSSRASRATCSASRASSPRTTCVWTGSCGSCRSGGRSRSGSQPRSEEHTSELQSREKLVCRLLLETK